MFLQATIVYLIKFSENQNAPQLENRKRFITCTLKNPDTRDSALNLQHHKHFPQLCKKRETNCRYGAPWFPCLKTVIQVSPRVKYKLETVTEEES